jgi:hypothetical protein
LKLKDFFVVVSNTTTSLYDDLLCDYMLNAPWPPKIIKKRSHDVNE